MFKNVKAYFQKTELVRQRVLDHRPAIENAQRPYCDVLRRQRGTMSWYTR